MCAGIPWVLWGAEMLVGAPAAIGKLDGVSLAEVDHARRHQLAHQGSGVRCFALAPGRSSAHGDLALDLHQVLDGDRYPVQRANRVAGADGLVRSLSRKPGISGIDRDEGPQLRLQSFDTGKILVNKVNRR